MEGIPPNSSTIRPVLRKKPKPEEQFLNCPRCNSTNTKFCFFNNYSFTQPRYFCKTCRRYWTEVKSLRKVSPASTASSSKVPAESNPPKLQVGHDLNLALSAMGDTSQQQITSLSVLGLLKPAMAYQGMNPHNIMPSSDSLYPSGFPIQDIQIKPASLGFSVGGLENRSYGVQENIEGGSERLFPLFRDIKQLSTTTDAEVDLEHNEEQGDST